MTHLDVAIVGGGPAGLAVAIASARRGLRVAVLEREQAPVERIGESVPSDLRPLLAKLGVWSAFAAQGHLPSTGNASAWQGSGLVRSDAITSISGGGWHIDRCGFEAMLGEQATAVGASVRRSTRVLFAEAGRVHAVAPGGRQLILACRVLVDATGAAATVSQWLGARRRIHDRLVCAYARFADAGRATREGRTLVEATADGWWYATPLPGGDVLVALFCDPRTARTREYRMQESWLAALRETAHVADYVGPRGGDVHMTAVTAHCLDRPASRDWLAIGDAAATLDPLASAGITLALRDGLSAADAIERRLAGDSGALLAHAETIHRRFARYLAQRHRMYALPGRWQVAPFWRARNGETAQRPISRSRSGDTLMPKYTVPQSD